MTSNSARERAKEDLTRSGIDLGQAEYSGIFPVSAASTIHPSFSSLSALVIPYMDPETGKVMQVNDKPFLRVRYLDSPPQTGFTQTKVQRYAQPPDTGTCAYFPNVERFSWPDIISDPQAPIIITEGEKKALSACLHGFPTIGLGGVYNFTASNDLLPELQTIPWAKRVVYICYDSDAAYKGAVQSAENALAVMLSRQYKARVYLVRLPESGDGKCGLDDYLLANGPDMFEQLLSASHPMRRIDEAVLEMNRDIAWIENEGMVYDLKHKIFIDKSSLLSGSKYSTTKLMVPTAKGDSMKQIQVIGAWLTDEKATRYQQILFRPGQAETFEYQDAVCKNLWDGWNEVEGDVQPFLDLTTHLFDRSGEGMVEFIIKLLAYKMQRPMEKVGICPVLLGTQGCGKSFWTTILRDMVGVHGIELDSEEFVSSFNGHVEKTFIAVVNEAESKDVQRGRERLKKMITDKRSSMNEKFRARRQVDNFALYMLTSNQAEVGSFGKDDRRMFVVGCPPKREQAFYKRIDKWYRDGGPAHVAHYLLNYPLGSWYPPDKAPDTAEKAMAYYEGLTAVQAIADKMLNADGNAIKLWVDASYVWAQTNELSSNAYLADQARALLDALPLMQIRPFYSADELARIFPDLMQHLEGAKYDRNTTTGQLSRELRNNGISYLLNKDDVRGFKVKGIYKQYLVIADRGDWRNAITQNEFDRLIRNAPRYADT